MISCWISHLRFTYVLGAPLGGQIAAHLQYSRLGSIVRNPVMVTVYDGSRHGSNQDNRTMNILLGVHLTRSSTSCEENSRCVHFEDLHGYVRFLLRSLAEAPHLSELINRVVQGVICS